MQFPIRNIASYHLEDYPQDLTTAEIVAIIQNPGTVVLWADSKTPRSISDVLTLEVLKAKGAASVSADLI